MRYGQIAAVHAIGQEGLRVQPIEMRRFGMYRLGVLLLLVTGIAEGQQAGNALQFDGGNDFAAVPHQSALSFGSGQSATFELWLKPTAAPTIWHAFGKRGVCAGTADLNYQLARDNTSLVHFRSGNCLVSANQDLPLNQWSHVAVTANGTNFRIFIDGEFVNAATCDFAGQNISPLVFGNSDSCQDTFPGLIDEVRIWNVARTGEQVADSYPCDSQALEPGLVAYWKFDEAESSQSILDSSASEFDGTLGASPEAASDDPQRVISNAPFVSCPIFKDGFETLSE